MSAYSFNGTTTVAPQVLVRSIIGAQRALALLPNGVICFVGAADGGEGNGTYYVFNDTRSAARLLRAGDLLDALVAATNEGASAGFIAVVANTKTPAMGALAGTASSGTPPGATITSGDYGTWNNAIAYKVAAGTTSGFMFTLTYPDQFGNTVTIGGAGSAYDNLVDLAALNAAIQNDSIVSPVPATGLPSIVSLDVTENGVPSNTVGFVNLTGGTGTGTDPITLAEVKEAVDEVHDIPFDLGHLVKCYDPNAFKYADTVGATKLATYGNLRRWIHQASLTGASKSNSKAINSEAVANSGIAAAASLGSFRSSVMVQHGLVYNPGTGTSQWMDMAPLVCGRASFIGANDQWGPASPLTKVAFATVQDLDYVTINTDTQGDTDAAISGGVWLFERIGRGGTLGSVRTIQSVTTAPVDPSTGKPWLNAEFSIVRVSDAVLASVKGSIEANQPRALGGGNGPKTMAALLSDVVNVLELAKDQQWIVSYDRSSINVATVGVLGDTDELNYSMVPTPPLNHIGVTQTLLSFQAQLSAGGTVSS